MKKRGVPPVFRGLAGAWLYRSSGKDGNKTLVGNETLAAGVNVLDYGTLTLAGFTLAFNAATPYAVIRAREVVGGGVISVDGCHVIDGAGAARQTVGGAYGGAGGATASRIRIYAESWSGSYTIRARGTAGEAGAVGPTAPDAGLAAGNYPANAVYAKLMQSVSASYGTADYAGGAPGGTEGQQLSLATLEAGLRTIWGRYWRDVLRLMMSAYGVADLSTGDFMASLGIAGYSGASGTTHTGAAAPGTVTSAGGGSGGPNAFGDPGAPGAGKIAVTEAAVTVGCGGGGGGGGAGGLAEVFGDRVNGSVIIDVSGGGGGAGGNGAVSAAGGGTARAPGGGGGSGGAGGAVLADLPRGKYTLTRNGGAGGAGGAGRSFVGVDAAYDGVAGGGGDTGYVIGERR